MATLQFQLVLISVHTLQTTQLENIIQSNSLQYPICVFIDMIVIFVWPNKYIHMDQILYFERAISSNLRSLKVWAIIVRIPHSLHPPFNSCLFRFLSLSLSLSAFFSPSSQVWIFFYCLLKMELSKIVVCPIHINTQTHFKIENNNSIPLYPKCRLLLNTLDSHQLGVFIPYSKIGVRSRRNKINHKLLVLMSSKP